ncbi:aldehyde dehydrogenase family protein [Anaerolineales bacterium]
MTLNVVNPYSGENIQTIRSMSDVDVREAIDRAVTFKPDFANMPAYQRAQILRKAAYLIETYAAELADLIVAESAKPIPYAKGEVARAVETFNFAADAALQNHGEVIQMDAAKGGVGKIGYYVREPIGVVAAITPFNFPLNLVAHKVAPAIAAACPIVLKPSPMTPLTALRLREILLEAGLPEATFQVVVGDVVVGQALTTDPRIAMITFTGSYPVAEAISKVAGVRRIAFELGGNAATIIDQDTPINDALVKRLIGGSFAYSGQVCISIQRIYIHESLYDELKAALVKATQALKLGDPADPATDIGPLINDQAPIRVKEWLNAALEQGAKLLVGGNYEGRLFEPTILENVTNTMQIMCAEAFAPLVNLIPYADFEAVLDQVNDSEFGLQAGVFTPSMAKAMLAIKKLDVGGVIINDTPTFRVDHMPYGGNKKSGVGREGPRFALDDLTTLKMVVINP